MTTPSIMTKKARKRILASVNDLPNEWAEPDTSTRYSICEGCGKRAYPSFKAAAEVRKNMRNKARIYRGEHQLGCTGWHIAHAEKLGIRRWRDSEMPVRARSRDYARKLRREGRAAA